MSEEIKIELKNWIIRVLKAKEKASPEELAILPGMIGYLDNSSNPLL